MNVKSPTQMAMRKLIPPLTAWAIGKILELPSVQDGVTELDHRARKQRRYVERSIERRVRNAKSNLSWLAGGAVAIGIGIALIAKAVREK